MMNPNIKPWSWRVCREAGFVIHYCLSCCGPTHPLKNYCLGFCPKGLGIIIL